MMEWKVCVFILWTFSFIRFTRNNVLLWDFKQTRTEKERYFSFSCNKLFSFVDKNFTLLYFWYVCHQAIYISDMSTFVRQRGFVLLYFLSLFLCIYYSMLIRVRNGFILSFLHTFATLFIKMNRNWGCRLDRTFSL